MSERPYFNSCFVFYLQEAEEISQLCRQVNISTLCPNTNVLFKVGTPLVYDFSNSIVDVSSFDLMQNGNMAVLCMYNHSLLISSRPYQYLDCMVQSRPYVYFFKISIRLGCMCTVCLILRNWSSYQIQMYFTDQHNLNFKLIKKFYFN